MLRFRFEICAPHDAAVAGLGFQCIASSAARERWEEVDLAVAELEGRAPSGMKTEVLLSLPLVLLLPPGQKMPKQTFYSLSIAQKCFSKGRGGRGI